jgi:hypothetical protein
VSADLLCASNRAASGANASLTLVEGTEQGKLRGTDVDRVVDGSASRLNGENKGSEERYKAHHSLTCGDRGVQVVQKPALYTSRVSYFRRD